MKTSSILSFCAGLLCALSVTSVLAVEAVPEAKPQPLSKRPNIVLILADDLGFTDLASYGSEINTPSLDALANEGIRFTNYHTAANCAPARAMLLTGVDNHRAGVANIPEMTPPQQRHHPAYQGVLGDNVVTVATLLEGAGYRTYMAGKWHLGQTQDKLPSRRGFQRTVAMGDSGADNWEQKPYLPIYEKANWYADGEPIDLPDDFYSSEFLVDKMIGFIESDRPQSEQPFFAYLPFMAVHIPVQAPQEFTDRYEGVYLNGWTALREARRQRAIDLGIVPPDVAAVDMDTSRDWDALSEEDKRFEAKRMAVYAGMVEAMDFHIGRLVTYLKDIGEFDNTVFIFTSDNGSEPSGPAVLNNVRTGMMLARQDYTADYDTLGLKGSFVNLGPSFASASASPLAYYKFYVGEGGLRVPMIMAGKPLAVQQKLSNAFAYVADITPTILALTGVSAPDARYAGKPVEQIMGKNLLPLATAELDRVYSDSDYVGYELAGHGVLFQGDYKLVYNRAPVGDNTWRLFNIVADPGETRDLSAEQSGRFQAMLTLYEQYKLDNGVLDPPKGYNHQHQVVLNGLHDRFRAHLLLGLFMIVIAVVFIVIAKHHRSR
jgi:arylsulfatase A-like enzyme